MKTKTMYYLVTILFAAGFVLFFSCKKENNGTVSSTQVKEAQQSESDDAMADKIEQDQDNMLDKLESNGYSGTSAKAALDDCVSITIDSTTHALGWPRKITLIYDCQDTVNGEVISQIGTIQVMVNRGSFTTGGYLYSRSITFTNYKVIADSVSLYNPLTSPSITINGTRTVTSIKISGRIIDTKHVMFDVTDSIKSNMSFAVNYGDTSVSFTRNVDRQRVAKVYLRRITGSFIWISDITKDTITYTGTVTGINARGRDYVREISTPVVCTFCPYWPYNLIISSGDISFSNDGGKIGDISYRALGCKTEVTLNVNGKTKTIERTFGRKFRRWW